MDDQRALYESMQRPHHPPRPVEDSHQKDEARPTVRGDRGGDGHESDASGGGQERCQPRQLRVVRANDYEA